MIILIVSCTTVVSGCYEFVAQGDSRSTTGSLEPRPIPPFYNWEGRIKWRNGSGFETGLQVRCSLDKYEHIPHAQNSGLAM